MALVTLRLSTRLVIQKRGVEGGSEREPKRRRGPPYGPVLQPRRVIRLPRPAR